MTDEIEDHVILAETARLEREFPTQKIEPAQFENLFEERLERYEEDKTMIARESEEQEDLLSKLREANAAFAKAKRGDTSTREREQALQRLENAYVKYKDIFGDIKSGRTFYNNLAPMISRFHEDCKNFAYQRRVEAGQLESDLSNALSSLNLSQTQNLQDQKQRETLRSHYSAKVPPSEILTAPVATRATVQPPPPGPVPGMWNPEMGIKFGGLPPSQQHAQGNGNVHNATYPSAKPRGAQWDMSQGVRFG